ncbi:MAG: hypothetical protein ACI85I_000727 [Arenicella sp.]|jgi:hypothetical protein
MKNTTMKSSIAKYFLVAVLAVSSLTVNAIGKDTTSVASKKSAKVFSKTEKAFFQEIETFYQDTYVKPVATINVESNFPKLEVYDLAGKLLHSQNKSHSPINLELLPKGATLLMTEGDTRIYLVM